MSVVGDALSALENLLGNTVHVRVILAAMVLVGGLIAGLLVGRFNRRLLYALGVDDAVEGTYFERSAQQMGTSTISIFSRLSSWFIYGVTVLATLHVTRLLDTETFWLRATEFIPNLFVAVAVVSLGILLGDKAELAVGERLRNVKLPELSFIPRLTKYSIIYVALLVGASQIGVATLALVVLLGAYSFAVIALAGLALQDLLRSGTAGIYLLLREPYGIGDRVEIGDHSGIVQEVTVFMTHIEDDGRAYKIPNHRALRFGVVVHRD